MKAAQSIAVNNSTMRDPHCFNVQRKRSYKRTALLTADFPKRCSSCLEEKSSMVRFPDPKQLKKQLEE